MQRFDKTYRGRQLGRRGACGLATVLALHLALAVAATAQDWFVAPPPAGNDANAGTSWAAPFATIQQGIVAAAGGETVIVSNGTYALGSQILLNKSVTVRSLNGATVTTVDAQASAGARRRVVDIAAAGAVLEGFTLRGGYAWTDEVGGGGGVRMNAAGTVRTCIIEENVIGASTGESWGGGLKLGAGLAENCIVRANRSLADNATIGGGGVYVDGGTLRGCLVYGNSANAYGGGVYVDGGLIESCTVTRNFATAGGGGVGFGNSLGTASLLNTIIHFNNVGGAGFADINPAAAATYCNAPTLTAGVGNLTNDPLFVAAGSGFGYGAVLGDPHLTPASPCINAGLDQPWMAAAADLDGETRVGGAAVDIGADEGPTDLFVGADPVPILVTDSRAELRCLLSGEQADVAVLWSTNPAVGESLDGWDGMLVASNRVPGSIIFAVSNLLSATTYFWRGFATNTGGAVWSPMTNTFTTYAPPATAYPPPAITGLVLHLAADAVSVSNGAGVAWWPDLTTHRHDFLQREAAAQPVWAAAVGALSNRPALFFDGQGRGLDGQIPELAAGADRTILMIAMPEAPLGSVGAVLAIETNRLVNLAPSRLYLRNGQQAQTLPGALPAAQAQLIEIADGASASPPTALTIGGAPQELVITAGTAGDRFADWSLAEGVGVGRLGSHAASHAYRGHVAEVLIYDRVLGAGDLQALRAYATAKYGVWTQGARAPTRHVYVNVNGTFAFGGIGTTNDPFGMVQAGIKAVWTSDVDAVVHVAPGLYSGERVGGEGSGYPGGNPFNWLGVGLLYIEYMGWPPERGDGRIIVRGDGPSPTNTIVTSAGFSGVPVPYDCGFIRGYGPSPQSDQNNMTFENLTLDITADYHRDGLNGNARGYLGLPETPLIYDRCWIRLGPERGYLCGTEGPGASGSILFLRSQVFLGNPDNRILLQQFDAPQNPVFLDGLGNSLIWSTGETLASLGGLTIRNRSDATARLNTEGGITRFNAVAPVMAVFGPRGHLCVNDDVAPAVAADGDFGVVTMPSGSVEQSFTIENTGGTAFELEGAPNVAIGGAHPGDFAVVAQPGLTTLPPGGSTTFTIRFRPGAPGLRKATVRIAHNDPGAGDPYTFAISGTGFSTTPTTGFLMLVR